MARIKAVLRRRAPQLTDDSLQVAGLVLNPATHRVTGNGEAINLGPTEFRILHFFMSHTERVYSRTQMLDEVWGDHVFVEERTVDVHIRRLRMALSVSGHDALVETVRGAGYRFRAA
jgi:two-component system phosphate regulon response regulator PhoB